MRFSLPKVGGSLRLAVVLFHDRLAVAALAGDRTETFTIATDNPAGVLREELTKRQLNPRTVALGLPRSMVFVKPMELPSVGGDLREMVRLNLDGHLPFAAEDTAFDFVPMPADGVRRDEPLQRVLLVAAEPRIVDAAMRIADEAKLRAISLTVAAHDLLALARPERDKRVVWVHRAGAAADVLCLVGSTLVLTRSVPGSDEDAVAEDVRRSLALVRWRDCDALWVSGDLGADSPALAAIGAPVSEPAYASRVRARLAALTPEDRGAQQLALAVALGKRGRPLDLLPRHLQPRRLTRGQALTLGVASLTALTLIAALLVPGYREQQHLDRINGEITRLNRDVQDVERTLRELERKKKLVGTITGIEAGAMRPLPVLRDLTDLLPSDTWLTTLSLDGKGVELTGQAAAASALIPLLENSPRLERVEFSSPVTRGRDKEQFRIRAAWETGGASAVTTAAPGGAAVGAPPPALTPGPAVTPPPPPGSRPPRLPQAPPGAVQPAPRPGGGRS